MIRPLLRLVAVAACAFALSGCITLLPKTAPAQLYRFSAGPPAPPPTAAPSQPAVAVYRTNGGFQNEAADDRILTVTGGRAAYIAASRWVAPAEVLFNQAMLQAFDASPVRMLTRGQAGKFGYALRVDVRNFEARYNSGPDAPPLVVVRLHAALTKVDQTSVGEREFEARVPAADNRVGAIVAAYNQAVADVIGKLVAWTKSSVTA